MTFLKDRCKGCALCVSVCPRKIISMDAFVINQRGFNPATAANTEKCTGCAFCAMICPDCAIAIEKE